MESHGGYLCRADEALDPEALVSLARRALALDGQAPDDVSLVIGVAPSHRVVRLAFDATFTYGRAGARWYSDHHSLARLASREFGVVVHAYVHDDSEWEQVTTYADGARVGGESLAIHDWEPPEGADELDEQAFERLKEKWPIGHLGRVYGVPRDALLRMARYAPSALLHLDAPLASELEALDLLWPTAARAMGA